MTAHDVSPEAIAAFTSTWAGADSESPLDVGIGAGQSRRGRVLTYVGQEQRVILVGGSGTALPRLLEPWALRAKASSDICNDGPAEFENLEPTTDYL